MPKTLHIKTFGCQMNEYDSERMAEALEAGGYVRTADAADADLVILNTCHIREKAAEKVYSELGRMRLARERRRREGRDTIIAVAGCVAQAEGEEIIARAPAVDIVVGPQSYHRLAALIAEARGSSQGVIATDFPAEEKFAHLPDRPRGKVQISAFITVQEGCDKFCTFCVVPYTRGAEFSRSVAEIVAEVERNFHGLEHFGLRAGILAWSVGAKAGGNHQWRRSIFVRQPRVGTELRQQLHQRRIRSLAGD